MTFFSTRAFQVYELFSNGFLFFFFCLETLWCVTATLRLEASDLEVLFHFYPQRKEGKINIEQVRLPAKQI